MGTALINNSRSCSQNAVYYVQPFYGSLSPLSLARVHTLVGLAPQGFGIDRCLTICLLTQTSRADCPLIPSRCVCRIAAGFRL